MPITPFYEFNITMLSIFQVESELGTVCVLINSAGLSVPGRFEDIQVEDFKVNICS